MPEHPDPKSRPHPWTVRRPDTPSPRATSAYAELQVTTNFSFLDGASHPEEFAERAAALGHAAVAITDRHTLAGVVRAHVAAKDAGIPLLVGAHLAVRPGPDAPFTDEPGGLEVSTVPAVRLLVYATSRRGYAGLCRLLTLGKRRTTKGRCDLVLHDVLEHHEDLLAIVLPPDAPDGDFLDVVRGLRSVFDDDRLSLALTPRYVPDDAARWSRLRALAAHVGVPLVATTDVRYHDAARRPLQDVLTCIRHGTTVHDAARRLAAHGEAALLAPEDARRRFAVVPEALERIGAIVARASAFSLDELRYEYPHEICPPGLTPMAYLRALTWRGAAERYPDGITSRVRTRLEHEFGLIDELNYAPYFLTVHDLVRFARGRHILCQGRGAAANSAVCYCLGRDLGRSGPHRSSCSSAS